MSTSPKTARKKTAPAAPAPVPPKEKRKSPRRALALDPQTAGLIAASFGQALSGLSLRPGARLSIHVGPHGSSLDYIKPPPDAAPQDDLADSFVRRVPRGSGNGARRSVVRPDE